jgi:hypothetical protein
MVQIIEPDYEIKISIKDQKVVGIDWSELSNKYPNIEVATIYIMLMAHFQESLMLAQKYYDKEKKK